MPASASFSFHTRSSSCSIQPTWTRTVSSRSFRKPVRKPVKRSTGTREKPHSSPATARPDLRPPVFMFAPSKRRCRSSRTAIVVSSPPHHRALSPLRIGSLCNRFWILYLASFLCSVGAALAQTEVSSGSDGPISNNSSGTAREEFMGGSDAQKSVYVQAEMQRVKCLSSGSSYNTNRLKLLDKTLHLLGKVRTSTEGEELEVLFANLNF